MDLKWQNNKTFRSTIILVHFGKYSNSNCRDIEYLLRGGNLTKPRQIYSGQILPEILVISQGWFQTSK